MRGAVEPGARHGAAAVGDLAALPPPLSLGVLMLRDWCEGPDGQERVWSAFAAGLPMPAARAGMRHFENLVSILAREGRRPLMRHAPACRCVGSDEAVFANLLATAATGEREDAMLVASLLVPAPLMPLTAEHARQAGLAIARLCLRRDPPEREPAPELHPSTVH